MEYLWLKYIHILSSTFLFGTGVGSAFYMFRANVSKDVPSIYFAARNVVLADWLFTTPTVIIQPITGFWMMHLLGVCLTDAWILVSIIIYLIVGACWLPVVFLQMKMRDLAGEALKTGVLLPPVYWRYEKIWFWLGVIAFPLMLIIVHLMVFKDLL